MEESSPSCDWAEGVREWQSLSRIKNKSLFQFSYNCVDIRKLSDSLFKATLLPIKLQKTESFGIHEEEFMNSITVNFKNAAICWMLITELCKKGQKRKSEQYFILLFSFEVDFITFTGSLLTAITLYCSCKQRFSGSEAPFSLCSLPTTLQKSTLGCPERLARAERRKKQGAVGVAGAELRVEVCVCNVWVVHQIIHASAPQLETEGGKNKMFKTNLDDFSGAAV